MKPINVDYKDTAPKQTQLGAIEIAKIKKEANDAVASLISVELNEEPPFTITGNSIDIREEDVEKCKEVANLLSMISLEAKSLVDEQYIINNNKKVANITNSIKLYCQKLKELLEL